MEFPAEILGALREETVKQVAEARVFQEVLPAGQNQTNSKEPVLRLSGTITHFKKVSRAKRYFGGVGGAGATEIDARIFFLDGTTGQQLMTQDLAFGCHCGRPESRASRHSKWNTETNGPHGLDLTEKFASTGQKEITS